MFELKKEQRQVIEHEQGSLLVTASAGSGKTFVMIERLIRLIVERKAKVSEILACTFTESAALDMKEKLKQALTKKIAEGDEDGYLSEQLLEVSCADICTIHSLCSRIVRSYFYIAEVAPDYQIADESTMKVLCAQVLNKTFREFYQANESWFNDLIDKFSVKRKDTPLKNIMGTLYKFVENLADRDEFFELNELTYSESGFNQIIDSLDSILKEKLNQIENQAVNAYAGIKQVEAQKYYEFCDNLYNDIRRAEKGDVFSIKEFADYKLDLPRGGKAPESAVEFKEMAVKARDAFKKLVNVYAKIFISREECLENHLYSGELSKGIIKIYKRYIQLLDSAKREDNLLSFSDLEHFALKVLSNEQALNDIREKYKYLFVDEYQDVNDVQEAIISKLDRDNLFMVGDAKQSIYGFRGCTPEIFLSKLENANRLNLKTSSLNCNFRCAKKVIDMTNNIFGYSMTKAVYGEDYSPKYNLIEGGVYPEDKVGRAEIHRIEPIKKQKEEQAPKVYNILQELNQDEPSESVDICSLVAKIINDELGKDYYDFKAEDGENKDKKISFKDIVILSRTINSEKIEKLVQGLVLRGIPVSSEVKQNICAYPEIQLLINALKLIDCFKQDVPLAVLLKSPVGNFCEEELAKIVIFGLDNKVKGGFYDYYKYALENLTGEVGQKLYKFDSYFNELRKASEFINAKGVVEKLFSDFGLENYLLAEANGFEMVKRMRRFVSLCEKDGKPLSVYQMLDLIENARDVFTDRQESDEDCVRVMTVHASKGLEFPVVIVCGLEGRFNAQDEWDNVLTDKQIGLGLKTFNKQLRVTTESPVRLLIKQRLSVKRVKEELRLFYVATTRAKYSLHLTISKKERTDENDIFVGANCFADFIPPHLPVREYSEEDLAFTNLKRQIHQVLVGEGDSVLEDKMQKNFQTEYEYIEDTKLPLKASVTGVTHIDELFSEYRYSVEDITASTDNEKGTIAHKILQNLDFSKRSDLSGQVELLIERGILTKEEIDGVSLGRIQKALNDNAFNGIELKELYKEKSFIVNVPANMLYDVKSSQDVLVQGIIDLLIISFDSAEIIDYKYSSLNSQGLVKRYKGQLDLYAFAVEKILKLKVNKKTIVNIFTGESVQV